VARGTADRRSPRRHARPGAARARLTDAWVHWLSPHFADNGSLYFTGTYCDEYGYANGLMLTRNVQRDFLRFLKDIGYDDREWCCAVEPHADRDIKHLHAIVQGDFTESDRLFVQLMWQVHRGWAKALPVTDGCESYVTKYALKSTVEAFDFRFRREVESA